MKNDDELALKKEKNDNDARAVSESELLPIFEAMNFSGDIQPLEDFEIPEPVAAQDVQNTDIKGTEKGRDLNKKKIPILSGFNRILQIVITAAIALTVIGGAAYGISYLFNMGKNASPIAAVYSSDKSTFMRLEDDKTYELSDVQNIKVSEDGLKAYYSKNTRSKTDKYDIRFVDAGKLSSLKKGGGNICTGADEGWTINSDGSLMSYSITKSGVKRFYIYSAEDGRSKEIASDIDEVFLPPVGDVIYFTRRNGSIYSLHRMRYGENSQNVASELSYVNFYGSKDGYEILYTVKSTEKDSTGYSVYSVKAYDEAKLICENADEIYLNDYVYGGNLYYFKKKESNVNWQDFINDSYYESDMKLQKPVESDYMIEYGFIFKRYILDKASYEAAESRYNAKLIRDSIRDALNQIDFGIAAEGEYTCFVHNNTTDKMLASGVSLKNVLGFSEEGAPRVIFRKSVINVNNKISMDELVKRAGKSDATDAADYVRSRINAAYSLSDDCIYIWYDGSKVLQYTINDYKDKQAIFYLASQNVMYGTVNDRLYCNKISQSKIERVTRIATGVSECEINGSFIYYKKQTDVESLYRYNPEVGEQRIGDNVSSYVVFDDNCVLIFVQNDSNPDTALLGIFNGSSIKEIDSAVAKNRFVRSDNSVAYLKDVGNSSIQNAGSMYIFTAGGDTVKTADDVTDIRFINESTSVKDGAVK